MIHTLSLNDAIIANYYNNTVIPLTVFSKGSPDQVSTCLSRHLMKKKLILPVMFLATLFTQDMNAQWIQSITATPSNPTSNDPITFIVNSNFPSGDCDQSTQFVQVNGNIVEAYAIHCLGFATFICNDTDTFTVSPLPPGNYTFRLQLDMGGGPAPCTPGIIPAQTDSINLTVSLATDIGEQISSDEIVITPNPASDFITIQSLTDAIFPVTVKIFSIDGKIAGNFRIENSKTSIETKHLPAGFYQLQVQTAANQISNMPLIITR